MIIIKWLSDVDFFYIKALVKSALPLILEYLIDTI